MTANELRNHFNRTFGLRERLWPTTFEVDAETYGNCCQAVFDAELERQFPSVLQMEFRLEIALGPNNGLMFKNVELLIKGKNNDRTSANS